MSVSCHVVIEGLDDEETAARPDDMERDPWAPVGGEDAADPGFNGMYLLEDVLTAVAVRLGVRPLLSFLAHPVQPGAEIVETGGLVAWGYPVAWHDPAAGLQTVRALVAHLSKQRGRSLGDREGILAALRALGSTLERIDGTGRRWHLAVSF